MSREELLREVFSRKPKGQEQKKKISGLKSTPKPKPKAKAKAKSKLKLQRKDQRGNQKNDQNQPKETLEKQKKRFPDIHPAFELHQQDFHIPIPITKTKTPKVKHVDRLGLIDIDKNEKNDEREVKQKNNIESVQTNQNSNMNFQGKLIFRFIRHAHDNWDRETKFNIPSTETPSTGLKLPFYLNPSITNFGEKTSREWSANLFSQNGTQEPILLIVSPYLRCLETAFWMLKGISTKEKNAQQLWKEKVLSSISLSRLIPQKEKFAYQKEIDKQIEKETKKYSASKKERKQAIENNKTLKNLKQYIVPENSQLLTKRVVSFLAETKKEIQQNPAQILQNQKFNSSATNKHQEIWIVTHGVVLYEVAKLLAKTNKTNWDFVKQYKRLKKAKFLDQLILTWENLIEILDSFSKK